MLVNPARKLLLDSATLVVLGVAWDSHAPAASHATVHGGSLGHRRCVGP